MAEPKRDWPEESGKSKNPHSSPATHFGVSSIWLVLPFLLLALWAGSVLERLAPHFKWQILPIAAAAIATILFALILNRFVQRTAGQPAEEDFAAELQQLLDSAGPGMLATDARGRLIYCNHALENMLGYQADELKPRWDRGTILAPEEDKRLVAEVQKLFPPFQDDTSTRESFIAACLSCINQISPDDVPNFDAELRRKDGTSFPATLHVCAFRSAAGETLGVVSVDKNKNQAILSKTAQRDSLEHYQDFFEHSSDLIAIISLAGRILYANPALLECFDLDNAEMLALKSFEDLFVAGNREEVASCFSRALAGEAIEHVPLQHHTADGRRLDLELSLSLREKAGRPQLIRCQICDVTRQKQRERLLALQLSFNKAGMDQLPVETASTRILEALCTIEGWSIAIEWRGNAEGKPLKFGSAWAESGRDTEGILQESMSLKPADSSEIPARAWKEDRAIWISDLTSEPATPRIVATLREGMISGWAIPVHADGKTVAVVEFYTNDRMKENREAMAAANAAAAILGQLLAQPQDQKPAGDTNRLQAILLDAVSEGICGLDREGTINYANPAAAHLLGMKASELIGRSVHELVHGGAPADQACDMDCPLRADAAFCSSSSGESNFYRTDGTSFATEYSLATTPRQEQFQVAVLSFRDISKRSAASRIKDEFISTVSHELRTPLTSIRGALGLLSSGMLGGINEKASNLLRIALTNSDRLVRLINDILDLERMQSGREPLAFRSVQLADIVKQAIDDMRPMADAAHVQLIHDATKVEITADPDRLLQIITNLLSNAVKFSPPNSPVSVMLRPGVTGVILSVIDHGRGIPADKLEAIFGRFQQVEASDARKKGGTGLGLAICRTIVRQHSGRIWAERNPVRGSTFRIFLPYHPAPASADSFETSASHGAVVLADANAESRPKIAAQLAQHGYSVVQAATVEQTLLSAANQSIQAVLLDTSLDGMNGWEILPKLRQMDETAHTPVVLMSVEDPKTAESLPGGAEGWVPKPLQEEALLAELARVLCGKSGKARILIVEDDRDLAHIISEVFTRDSISVQTAHSLGETIEVCSTFQPHLMVLDIGLPDGDGFNVVDWLKQQEDLAHLPLVVYSGRELTVEQRRQLTLGPTHFLAKTRVQPQQLEAMVLTMLHSSRKVEKDAQTDA